MDRLDRGQRHTEPATLKEHGNLHGTPDAYGLGELGAVQTLASGGVTGGTFRGAGKTDLLLRWKERDAFIAECRFWSGPARFKDAVDQLLSYTVWRDTRIALILFLRDIAVPRGFKNFEALSPMMA